MISIFFLYVFSNYKILWKITRYLTDTIIPWWIWWYIMVYWYATGDPHLAVTSSLSCKHTAWLRDWDHPRFKRLGWESPNSLTAPLDWPRIWWTLRFYTDKRRILVKSQDLPVSNIGSHQIWARNLHISFGFSHGFPQKKDILRPKKIRKTGSPSRDAAPLLASLTCVLATTDLLTWEHGKSTGAPVKDSVQ